MESDESIPQKGDCFELANCTCIILLIVIPSSLFKFNATIYGNVQKGELRKS